MAEMQKTIRLKVEFDASDLEELEKARKAFMDAANAMEEATLRVRTALTAMQDSLTVRRDIQDG